MQGGAGAEQPVGEASDRLDQMFAVVEDDEGAAFLEVVDEGFDDRAVGVFPDGEGGCDGLR